MQRDWGSGGGGGGGRGGRGERGGGGEGAGGERVGMSDISIGHIHYTSAYISHFKHVCHTEWYICPANLSADGSFCTSSKPRRGRRGKKGRTRIRTWSSSSSRPLKNCWARQDWGRRTLGCAALPWPSIRLSMRLKHLFIHFAAFCCCTFARHFAILKTHSPGATKLTQSLPGWGQCTSASPRLMVCYPI